MANKKYLCIDLKSFYASCECVLRGLDSLKTDLVVADPKRGDGALCLAVSASLKEKGVRNRCRLFEIPKNLNYIIALPRMKKYIEYSSWIYKIYEKYVSKDDILVYSIDECFLDVTDYLKMYGLDEISLAKRIIDDVMKTTGICATAGVGTNMFLAKVALDITAKHEKSHIGYLDEEKFKKEIWFHTPLTDIWNIGEGITRRLMHLGCFNLYDVAHTKEEILYKEFGKNALFLIDHSKGIEPCTIKECHEYKSKDKSLSNSQILFSDYNYTDALLVFKEMVETNLIELISSNLYTNSIDVFIGYSKEGGSQKNKNLGFYTNDYKLLHDELINLFLSAIDKNKMVRRLGLGFGHVIDEEKKPISLFDDENKKDKNLIKAITSIKKKYGKNSILKGMNLEEKSTQKKRNTLIGGHNGE
jgi:DNA polymerase V